MKIGTDSDCWSVPNGQLLKVELETVAFTSLSALAFSANPWTLSPPVLLFFYRRTSVFIRFYQVLCVFFATDVDGLIRLYRVKWQFFCFDFATSFILFLWNGCLTLTFLDVDGHSLSADKKN